MSVYSVDTSSLVEAAVRRYPRQAFPALWDRIERLIEGRRLIAIEEVRTEIERRDDRLFAWAKAQAGLFVPITEEVALAVKDLMRDHGNLMKTGKNRNMADPWVIALAQVQGAVVVTEEEGGNHNKPKIPSVCQALGVECINVVEMILREGWSF